MYINLAEVWVHHTLHLSPIHDSNLNMHALSSLATLVSLCSGLTAAFTNPIRTGSDPQIVYVDGLCVYPLYECY